MKIEKISILSNCQLRILLTYRPSHSEDECILADVVVTRPYVLLGFACADGVLGGLSNLLFTKENVHK